MKKAEKSASRTKSLRGGEGPATLPYSSIRSGTWRAKKYGYVVIYPSDGTYNHHLTYFKEKSKYEERTKNMVLTFDVITPD